MKKKKLGRQNNLLFVEKYVQNKRENCKFIVRGGGGGDTKKPKIKEDEEIEKK